MTFPEFLRAEVLRLGRGTSSHGEQLAAIVLDWSPRKIRGIIYESKPVSKTDQAGAQILLARARPLPQRAAKVA